MSLNHIHPELDPMPFYLPHNKKGFIKLYYFTYEAFKEEIKKAIKDKESLFDRFSTFFMDCEAVIVEDPHGKLHLIPEPIEILNIETLNIAKEEAEKELRELEEKFKITETNELPF